jgi:TetR/AcrR family transcriptional repressor of mexCD-oprJ operon
MRADAARNVQRIVEVAARLLGEDPSVGMADVAAAAGVSRATVYRHFPTREALILAIREQAFEHTRRALEDARIDEGSATDALRRLVAGWLDVAQRYSFAQLAAQPEISATRAEREPQRRAMLGPLLALIERGQAAGEFTSSLPASWIARSLTSLLLAAARSASEGMLEPARAADVVVDTLLDGVRA